MDPKAAWLSLAHIPAMNGLMRRHIFETFLDPVDAWRAGPEAWAKITGVRRHEGKWREYWSASHGERILERCRQEQILVTTWQDETYPDLLREIAQPPLVLYGKGMSFSPEEIPVAVVGTRRPDSYGVRATERVVDLLSEFPVVFVSGLALGIDGVAHRRALRNKKRTLAVLGCGVDQIYPSEHRELYGRIAEHGRLLSEFPPGTQPFPSHFPARNRIIAGLSRAVIVAQAPIKSGALITARHAVEANRDVWAIPADITREQSKGCLHLIRDGAGMIGDEENLLDIVRQWLPDGNTSGHNGRHGSAVRSAVELGGEEQRVFRVLCSGWAGFDELCERTGMQPAAVNAALTVLQIYGYVETAPGPRYMARA